MEYLNFILSLNFLESLGFLFIVAVVVTVLIGEIGQYKHRKQLKDYYKRLEMDKNG